MKNVFLKTTTEKKETKNNNQASKLNLQVRITNLKGKK